MGRNISDISGQRFGKLTVVRATEQRKNGSVVWECKCDCGNTAFVASRELISGKTESCRCLRKKYLSGQRFGKLTAVRPMEQRKKGIVVWECKCDCGNTTYVTTKDLSSGNTKSCGCLKQVAADEMAEKLRCNLENERFGRLTVIRATDKRDRGYIVWECKCDCGNTTYVTTGRLRSGNTKSCGCRNRKAGK